MNLLYRNGRICIWECTINPDDLVEWKPPIKKKKLVDSDSEDDVNTKKAVEKLKAHTLDRSLLESGKEFFHAFYYFS